MKTSWFLCLVLFVTGCVTLPPAPRQTYHPLSVYETPSSTMTDDLRDDRRDGTT